jgi:hypothetical protein
MTQKHIKIIGVITGLVLVLVALYAFTLYYDRGAEYPKSVADFSNTGNYKIDPANILSDINGGNINVFEYVDNTLVTETSEPSAIFLWTQPDYLKVITTLHQFVWKEDVSSWSVAGLVFSNVCRDTPVGFESGDIVFFKYNPEEKTYTFHEIVVYPNRKLASWGGDDKFTSPLFGWKKVELNKLTITAEKALQIAEDHGGKEFRSRVNNLCTIDIILKPNSDYGNNWLVYYDTENADNSFEIFIDPYRR